MNITTRLLPVALLAGLAGLSSVRAEDEREALFSGPQQGERLLPFKVMGVYDDLAGKELDFVSESAGRPLFLIFVHKLTRPSWGLTRLLASYVLDRRKDGISAAIVWLHEADDRSRAEAYLARARGSLRVPVPLGLSLDGAEGPGAYGLNRNVTLTVLVAKENTVTANFALVQPSDRDAPKILAEVVKLIGGEAPTAEDLRRYAPRGMRMRAPDRRLVRILRRLESSDLTAEELAAVVAEVERYVGDAPARQRALGTTARDWTRAADFAGKGTPAARSQLEAWASRYAPPRREQDPRFRELLQPVIQKDAPAEDVERAIAAVEKYVAESPERQRQLGDIASRVVGGRIYAEGGYGTPRAREQLKKWAEKYGSRE